MTQHRQYSQPKSKHQGSIKRPPRADRGAHHGLCWEAHGRACLCCFGFAVFARLFVLQCVFLLFCLYNVMYLDILKHPIHSIAFSFHSKSFQSSFRERKRERRRTTTLDRALRSKDGSTRLDEQILSLLLSFLISCFIFCNFDLNTCSFDLRFYACLV